MRKSLSLRLASRRRTEAQGHSETTAPETVASAPTLPVAAGHHAHTAGGREITGFWGWFERGTLLATLISVALGAWAYLEDRQTRHDEAINRAWSTLTTPATGNSGKREALEYLAAQGVSLRGIDLSCEKMGGGWDPEKMTCANPVYLEGLSLKAPKGQRVDLRGAHLEGANLAGTTLKGADLRDAFLMGTNFEEAHLEGTNLRGAHLERAQLWETHLEGARLRAAHLQAAYMRSTHLEDAHLWRADLQGAILGNAHLERAHVTATDFTDATGLETAIFTDAWSWSYEPPVGLPDDIEISLCKAGPDMSRSARPDPCIPPD